MQNLADLHWVPVRGRIKYKVALLTFKTLITHRPMYLHDLLQFHTSPRHLRSSEHHSLHVAGARTVFGSRAFCHAAPTVWNSLPLDLTDDSNTAFLSSFKKDLQTHFYRVYRHANHSALGGIIPHFRLFPPFHAEFVKFRFSIPFI